MLNLHGYNSNAAQQEQLSRMSPMADQAGFIVVYPEALEHPPAWHVASRAEAAAILQYMRQTKLSGKTRRVNVTLPERVVSLMDKYADEHGETRSRLITQAAIEYIASREGLVG